MINRLPRLLRWILHWSLLFLLLMSAYRLYFFFHFRPEGRPFSGSTFLLGLRYDLRIVSVVGLLVLLLTMIRPVNPIRNPGAIRWWNLVLTIIFLVILLFYGADFYHYDYLKQRLNASVLNFMEDAAISAGMMWQTYPLIRIGLLLIAALWLFARWHRAMLRHIYDAEPWQLSRYGRFALSFTFVLSMSVGVFGKLGQYPLRWSDAFAFTDEFKAHTALNPFQSFFSTLSFRKSGYDLPSVKRYYPLMAGYLGVQKPDTLTLNYTREYRFADTPVHKPNVVVVICESFSAYMSSMYGNPLNTTPYFNSLCQQGVFFNRCFTPAFGTARGVWAVITGIPDVEQAKTASRNPLAVDQHTIINDFNGYEKFYFLGGSTTWANIRGLLNNNIAGLQIFEEEQFRSKKVDVWGISDKNLFLESNKILATRQKPFFAIIQTADNHRPYTIPAEDIGPFDKVEFPDDSLRKYGFENNAQLNAFRYTDFTFKTFIEAAKKEPYFNNTIFVFVGDHGLRGNPGGLFPQSFSKQGIHAEHVPLLFYSPALLKPASISQVCSQLDILPSVAALCRQPFSNTTLGRNLFDTSFHHQPYAFIADPDVHTIGLVGDRYYYGRNLKTGEKDFVSVTGNDMPATDPSTDSLRKYMTTLTEAWYETSRYLLQNNKKKN